MKENKEPGPVRQPSETNMAAGHDGAEYPFGHQPGLRKTAGHQAARLVKGHQALSGDKDPPKDGPSKMPPPPTGGSNFKPPKEKES